MKRVKVTVNGRVQGVGYRASVHRRISALNVTGYVMNMPDGSVELDIQGADADVDAAVDIAKKGSAFSSVSRADVFPAAVGDNGTQFVIKK